MLLLLLLMMMMIIILPRVACGACALLLLLLLGRRLEGQLTRTGAGLPASRSRPACQQEQEQASEQGLEEH